VGNERGKKVMMVVNLVMKWKTGNGEREEVESKWMVPMR